MKYRKQIVSLLLSVWLACALSAAAYAHEIPDEHRKGTITVDMIYDGKAVTGGSLAAYRVGRIQEDNGDYSFIKTAAMADFSGSYDDISSPKLAEAVSAFVREHGVPADKTADNITGKVSFPDLELGLYLIVQTQASEGFQPLKPFLISLPMNEGGHYQYELSAEGKFQLVQPPSPTPAPPENPSVPVLPQTGQLNWPIPVLAVLGLGLFTGGWLMRFGRKRDRNEK